MKSKAQEFYDEINRSKPNRPVFKASINDQMVIASVVSVRSKVTCALTACELFVEDALALRDWLTDTFDVPNGPIDYSRKETADKDWIKDIKHGFVGITRSGEKMIYDGRHGDFFVWDHPDYNHDVNFYSIVRMYANKHHHLDIIGPWEETE